MVLALYVLRIRNHRVRYYGGLSASITSYELASYKVQEGKNAIQPSTDRIHLIVRVVSLSMHFMTYSKHQRESENATLSIAFLSWLCCYSSGAKEE